MRESPFQKISSQVVYANPWFRVEKHEVAVRADGHRFTYSFLSTGPSVMVVALTSGGKIVLVKQYRYPTGEFSFELPGGGAGGGNLRRAALKELQEETGYRAARLRKLGEFVVYCGLSNEVCHVFLARDLRSGRQKLERTEHLTVHEVSYDRLRHMIRKREFRDGMGLAALQIAAPALERELQSAR